MPGVKGAGAYARKRGAMEPDPLKRARLASRYSKGQQRLTRFEKQVMPCVDSLPGIRAMERNSLLHLARRMYGLSRKCDPEDLMAFVARAGAEWIRRECDPERVMATIVRSLSLRGVRLVDAEQAQLRKDIESNREGRMSSTEKQVVVNAAPVARRSPRRFVKLEEGDLSSRVREYFARNIDDAQLAESAAAELMTELQSRKAKIEDRGVKIEDGGEKASSVERPASGVERKASSVKRSASGVKRAPEFSMSEIERPAAYTLFARKRAATALRECLAVHEPIVRRAVVLRLTRLLPPAEIAEQLELELEDVQDILTQMRPWVRRFTTYFDQDRYWRDDAPRYSIPPLPQSGV